MTTEKRSLSIEARVTDLATSSFARMLGGARSFAGGAIPLFKATAVAFGAISAAAAGGFIVFRRYAEELDKVAKVSDRFGITAESLTAIRNGAELAGVGIDGLAQSMKTFEAVVSKANEGNRESRELLQQLGLDSTQFAGDQLNLVDVLSKVAAGLSGVGSAADRTAILVKLFGRSGADLAPLLREGSDGIKRMAAEAKAAGAVFSREELARVEEFNDSWTKLQQTLRNLAERLVSDLAPSFTKVLEEITAGVSKHSAEIRKGFLDTVDVLVRASGVMLKVFDGFVTAARGVQLVTDSLSIAVAAVAGAEGSTDVLIRKMREHADETEKVRDRFLSFALATDDLVQSLDRLRATPTPSPEAPSSSFKSPEAFKAFEDAMRRVGQEMEKAHTEADQAGNAFAKALTVPETFQAFVAAMARLREEWEKAAKADPWLRFQKGISDAGAKWRDFAGAAEEAGRRLVDGTMNNLTDALAAGISGTLKWRDAWKEFGRSTIAMLGQVLAKVIAVRAVSAIFGSSSVTAQANGGVEPGTVQTTLPLRGFASGGVVNRPTLAVMGEGRAPAEAFVPLPDGKSIPVTISGGEDQGQRPIVNNFNMTFTSADPMRCAALLKENRATILQIVGDAMQRSNSFRGTVKEASR